MRHRFLILFFVFVAAHGWAFDRLVVIDRGYDQNLFSVAPDGTFTGVTANVPWERANSVAVDKSGNFIVTVDIHNAYKNDDGIYRVTPDGTTSVLVRSDLFSKPGGIALIPLFIMGQSPRNTSHFLPESFRNPIPG